MDHSLAFQGICSQTIPALPQGISPPTHQPSGGHVFVLFAVGSQVFSEFQKGPFLARGLLPFPPATALLLEESGWILDMVLFTERGNVVSRPLAVKSKILLKSWEKSLNCSNDYVLCLKTSVGFDIHPVLPALVSSSPSEPPVRVVVLTAPWF